jgi:hypothetical protein
MDAFEARPLCPAPAPELHLRELRFREGKLIVVARNMSLNSRHSSSERCISMVAIEWDTLRRQRPAVSRPMRPELSRRVGHSEKDGAGRGNPGRLLQWPQQQFQQLHLPGRHAAAHHRNLIAFECQDSLYRIVEAARDVVHVAVSATCRDVHGQCVPFAARAAAVCGIRGLESPDLLRRQQERVA